MREAEAKIVRSELELMHEAWSQAEAERDRAIEENGLMMNVVAHARSLLLAYSHGEENWRWRERRYLSAALAELDRLREDKSS